MITHRVQVIKNRRPIDPNVGQEALDQMFEEVKGKVTSGANWGKLSTPQTRNEHQVPEWLVAVLKEGGFVEDTFNMCFYKDHETEGGAQATREWFDDQIRPWAIRAKHATKDEMDTIHIRLMVPHDELKNKDSW